MYDEMNEYWLNKYLINLIDEITYDTHYLKYYTSYKLYNME